jgi:hypothetical protein
VWNQTYGGTDSDGADSVVQTADGGFVLAGDTRLSWDSSADYWLIKTDASGNHEWNHTYGGAQSDHAHSVVQTTDGGYALAGETASFGAGRSDVWLVKTDASGTPLWDKTYGGRFYDAAFSLVQTVDGGYALAGYSYSFGTDFNVPDFWLVKVDGNGNHVWNQTYGGPPLDRARCVVQTMDGGFALVGETWSYGAGEDDVYLVKTDEFGVIPEFPVWTLLLVVIIFTATIIIYRRKLIRKSKGVLMTI